MKEIPISIYWTAEWWDRHYHVTRPRPDAPSQKALEAIYLGRLHFLFEQFGSFGIGQEKPILDTGQISTVIRYGNELIPTLLGTQYDLALWNIDPSADPEHLRWVFAEIDAICRENGAGAKFDPMPLCWEEMEWAHARYQTK